MLKVLVAIANTVQEVGYIQGLNSIAGVFLFYLKEEESFWMMLYLLEKIRTKDIFKSDFERVSILNYQLEMFVNNYLPEISQHFVKIFGVIIFNNSETTRNSFELYFKSMVYYALLLSS